jgi:hypothetical protein
VFGYTWAQQPSKRSAAAVRDCYEVCVTFVGAAKYDLAHWLVAADDTCVHASTLIAQCPRQRIQLLYSGNPAMSGRHPLGAQCVVPDNVLRLQSNHSQQCVPRRLKYAILENWLQRFLGFSSSVERQQNVINYLRRITYRRAVAANQD